MGVTESGEWYESRMPVLWHRLITEADTISQIYGLGLANVWQWINQEDYTKARQELDQVIADCEAGYWPINPENKYMKAYLQQARKVMEFAK